MHLRPVSDGPLGLILAYALVHLHCTGFVCIASIVSNVRPWKTLIGRCKCNCSNLGGESFAFGALFPDMVVVHWQLL
jgi:hypothetical protein